MNLCQCIEQEPCSDSQQYASYTKIFTYSKWFFDILQTGRREINDALELLKACNTVDGVNENIELPQFNFSSIVAATKKNLFDDK